MENKEINTKINSRSKAFFSTVAGEKPSLFNKRAWMGKVIWIRGS